MKKFLPILVTIAVIIIAALFGLIFGVNFFAGFFVATIAIVLLTVINIWVLWVTHKFEKIIKNGGKHNANKTV